jgi:hypothetical protein
MERADQRAVVGQWVGEWVGWELVVMGRTARPTLAAME